MGRAVIAKHQSEQSALAESQPRGDSADGNLRSRLHPADWAEGACLPRMILPIAGRIGTVTARPNSALAVMTVHLSVNFEELDGRS